MIRWEGGGCKWWHFYPDEGIQQLEEKYREILHGRSASRAMPKLGNYLPVFMINFRALLSAGLTRGWWTP